MDQASVHEVAVAEELHDDDHVGVVEVVDLREEAPLLIVAKDAPPLGVDIDLLLRYILSMFIKV